MLSRVLFVLGKGGVGRSTVSTALGLTLAAQGKKVLIVEWTVAEPIAPWFGLPQAGASPTPVAPGLSVENYRLDEALRAYFTEHLKLDFFYRHVVNGEHLRRLTEAAPGLAELLFLGRLWWLTTLAEEERGYCFDHIVVDTPATGHGASMLDLPSMLTSIGAAGMLGMEIERVVKMMKDPAWTSALVVSLPEELAMDETIELTPRATKALGHPPLAALINRSVAALGLDAERPPWLAPLEARLSPAARDGLTTVHAELSARVQCEKQIREKLEGTTRLGTFSLPEQLVEQGSCTPREVAEALAPVLRAHLEGA